MLNLNPKNGSLLSDAFQKVTSVPGIPMGHVCLLRGHSDTGKTTA